MLVSSPILVMCRSCSDLTVISVKPQAAVMEDVHDYVHLRDNPAGLHRELWYHEQGDRSWIVVTRDTVSHEIVKVELARDVKRREGADNGEQLPTE